MDDDDDNSWDLQAVVRGCGGGAPAAASVAETRDPFLPSSSACSPSLASTDSFGAGAAPEDDFLFCFPDLFTSQTSLHELEDLCKPFIPKHHQQQQQQQQPLPRLPPPSSQDLQRAGVGVARRLQQGVLIPQQLPRQQQPPPHRPFPQASRSKRRKNQQKKVVCQVPADGLSSDVWAWRKYGQKPIKGSPYPRGYYRCSSSKGCMARKQVERSRTDPGMFLITYTAEHNHPVPTHRNSLAGSTRNKFASSSSQKLTTGADGAGGSGGGDTKCDDDANVNKPGTSAPLLLSPPAPGEAAEDEPILPMEKEEGEEEADDDEEDMLLVSDMEMLGDEDVVFTGMEEKVDDEFLEAATDISTSSWMTNNVS